MVLLFPFAVTVPLSHTNHTQLTIGKRVVRQTGRNLGKLLVVSVGRDECFEEGGIGGDIFIVPTKRTTNYEKYLFH